MFVDKLSSFAPFERASALLSAFQSEDFPESSRAMNMHMHSFFSYNGEGWSPSRIAYEAKKMGLRSAGLCDFDVLQGMKEFLYAGDLLGLRTAVSFESRVFFPEYSEDEINSPGEPGVFYFMGCGFTALPSVGSQAEAIFNDMLAQSHRRNRALIDRINAKLPGARLDYDRDVLPLTPDKNATERHIVRAYFDLALKEHSGDCLSTQAFWSQCFACDAPALENTEASVNAFVEFLRGKLMKNGGLGYVKPTRDTFPAIDTVIKMIRECRGIPTSAWLDGSLPGEQNPRQQLKCLLDKGVEMVNIIPDRNWNFKDPAKKAKKIAALNEYIAAAEELELPIIVGTECNKPGQRKVDDFTCDALAPHLNRFVEGADILVGHTRLMRYADYGYCDERAKTDFPERSKRNAFFAAVGALPPFDAATRLELENGSFANNLKQLVRMAEK